MTRPLTASQHDAALVGVRQHVDVRHLARGAEVDLDPVAVAGERAVGQPRGRRVAVHAANGRCSGNWSVCGEAGAVERPRCPSSTATVCASGPRGERVEHRAVLRQRRVGVQHPAQRLARSRAATERLPAVRVGDDELARRRAARRIARPSGRPRSAGLATGRAPEAGQRGRPSAPAVDDRPARRAAHATMPAGPRPRQATRQGRSARAPPPARRALARPAEALRGRAGRARSASAASTGPIAPLRDRSSSALVTSSPTPWASSSGASCPGSARSWLMSASVANCRSTARRSANGTSIRSATGRSASAGSTGSIVPPQS
jgi:hypothetical protein